MHGPSRSPMAHAPRAASQEAPRQDTAIRPRDQHAPRVLLEHRHAHYHAVPGLGCASDALMHQPQLGVPQDHGYARGHPMPRYAAVASVHRASEAVPRDQRRVLPMYAAPTLALMLVVYVAPASLVAS